MVKRRPKNRLVPRSFLAGADLDAVLARESKKRTMTKSQLVRHLLIKQLQYEGAKGASALTEGEDE